MRSLKFIAYILVLLVIIAATSYATYMYGKYYDI